MLEQAHDAALKLKNDWYLRQGCSHAHCPLGCEHPQPLIGPDGELICGECYFKRGDVLPMIPCTPDTCS